MKIKYELRPCLVDGKKALFHCWYNYAKPLPPSASIFGDNGGQLSYTLGIVELEDGQINEVNPYLIKFIDNKIQEYYFKEQKEDV